MMVVWIVPPIPPAATDAQPAEVGPPNRCRDCTLLRRRGPAHFYCAVSARPLPLGPANSPDAAAMDGCPNYDKR